MEQRLTQQFEQAITIATRYGFQAQDIGETLQSMRSFTVTVPIIGAFNTGKSSMLNALLGSHLLPTGIVATTGAPTELVYGENAVTVRRNGRDSQVGLGELRGGLDPQGVTLLRVAFSHPFLQRISSVKLVDMPGLDSGVPGREQLLRDYLSKSLAYLLVFSADEPIVKESIALFLSELCLRNVPVFAVLNKCDKVAPEELAQAQQFLKQRLCSMFHLEDFALCCVSAREPGGTQPLAELLLTLQARTATLAQQKFSGCLEDYCRELRQYLSFRLAFDELPISELGNRILRLKNQSAALMQALEQENEQFLVRVASSNRKLRRRLELALTDMVLPMETMLSAGQNPHDYVVGMLRSTLAAGVLDLFEPAVSSYLRQMVGLLERRGTSGKNGGVVERFRQQAVERCAKKTATPAVETLLAQLPDTGPLFDGLLGNGKYLSEKQRDVLHAKIQEELLPQLRQALAPCIDNGLEQSAEAVRQLAQSAAAEESQTQERALFDIQLAKKSDDSLHQEGRQRLCDDLAAVDALLLQLNEHGEVAV